jgi:hypothetical protein
MAKWREYERLVAYLTANEQDNDSLTVIPNARITGIISRRKRQVDVLVECRIKTDLDRRIAIDAKLRKRPIDIKEVEAFEGMLKDVGAKNGIIVCSSGWTKAAEKRCLQNLGLRLIHPNEIENLSFTEWDSCLNRSCFNGLVLWDTTPGVFINGVSTVQSTGKCDECGNFHVWCWGCGNRKVLMKEEDWQCSCNGPWFWLTAIESEENLYGHNDKEALLLLVLGNGNYHVVDRRPI